MINLFMIKINIKKVLHKNKMSVIEKYYVDPKSLQLFSIKLGEIIYKNIDKFKPDWIIALWRGFDIKSFFH